MIYSDNTFDITNNIATYTRRDFKSVFDTTSNKWYMLNNLDNYEEYGIYGNSFDTYYPGKLVIVNDHEYEWDGTEWDDLGSYVEEKYPYILFPNSTTFSNSAYFETITPLKNTYTLEIKIKTPSSNGSLWRQVLGDYNSWNTFYTYMFALYTNQNNANFGMNWWNYGSSRIYDDAAFSMAANTEYIIKIQVGTGETYINDVLQSASGGNNANGTLSNNMRIAAGYSSDPGFNGQIYYVKITEGNELIAYYEANNDNNTPGYYESVSETKITKSGSGSITYGEDSESVRPKDYQAKATPTISTLWASTIYRNSAHLTTLMRNDAEQAKWSYMEDDILKKGEALPDFPYEVTDFSKNNTSNTIPIYGLMIKVGYPVSGSYNYRDLSFTTAQGATSSAANTAHINLIYQNGSYSDTRHSPAISNALISTLPTIEYNGENYYYYIFAVGKLYYNRYYNASGYVGALEEENVKLITEIY